MSDFRILTGHLAQDPETGVSDTGTSWTRMVVMTNDRYQDRSGDWVNGPAVAYRVSTFRRLAENTANCLHTGDPVLVAGAVTTKEYRDRDGNHRVGRDMIADYVGADLSHATADITRNPGRGEQP